MAYILKQTGNSYAINYEDKSYDAGNDITLAMEVIFRLNYKPKSTVEQRSDGLYISWDNKEKGYTDYEKVISYLPASGTQPSGTTIVTTTDKTEIYIQPIETTAVPPLPWSSIPIATPCIPWCPSDTFPNPPWTPSPSTPFKPVPLTVPQPVTGWVCPKCGNGVSPYTSICPCNNKIEITCKT